MQLSLFHRVEQKKFNQVKIEKKLIYKSEKQSRKEFQKRNPQGFEIWMELKILYDCPIFEFLSDDEFKKIRNSIISKYSPII